jgi:hypothetical protein
VYPHIQDILRGEESIWFIHILLWNLYRLTCGGVFWTPPWLTWCGLNKHLKSSWKRSTKRTHTSHYQQGYLMYSPYVSPWDLFHRGNLVCHRNNCPRECMTTCQSSVHLSKISSLDKVHDFLTHERSCDENLPKEWMINKRWRKRPFLIIDSLQHSTKLRLGLYLGGCPHQHSLTVLLRNLISPYYIRIKKTRVRGENVTLKLWRAVEKIKGERKSCSTYRCYESTGGYKILSHTRWSGGRGYLRRGKWMGDERFVSGSEGWVCVSVKL